MRCTCPLEEMRYMKEEIGNNEIAFRAASRAFILLAAATAAYLVICWAMLLFWCDRSEIWIGVELSGFSIGYSTWAVVTSRQIRRHAGKVSSVWFLILFAFFCIGTPGLTGLLLMRREWQIFLKVLPMILTGWLMIVAYVYAIIARQRCFSTARGEFNGGAD